MNFNILVVQKTQVIKALKHDMLKKLTVFVVDVQQKVSVLLSNEIEKLQIKKIKFDWYCPIKLSKYIILSEGWNVRSSVGKEF